MVWLRVWLRIGVGVRGRGRNYGFGVRGVVRLRICLEIEVRASVEG